MFGGPRRRLLLSTTPRLCRGHLSVQTMAAPFSTSPSPLTTTLVASPDTSREESEARRRSELRELLRSEGALIVCDKKKGMTCREASNRVLREVLGLPWIEISSSSTSSSTNPKRQRQQQDMSQRKGRAQREDDWIAELKVGHAGTLDPNATGCLPVLIGKNLTRLMNHLDVDRKRYVAVLKLGVETDSGDAEGAVLFREEEERLRALRVEQSRLDEVLRESFQGEITQVPPIYSAINIKGQRAYDLARAGQAVEMPSRKVMVYEISGLANYQGDPTLVKLDVTCGTGTYIRTIGTDVAKALGTRGHLAELRRVSSGGLAVPEEYDPDSSLAVGRRSLRETLASLAPLVELVASGPDEARVKEALAHLQNGRSRALFEALVAGASPTSLGVIPAEGQRQEDKVALYVDVRARALLCVEREARKITTLVHFT